MANENPIARKIVKGQRISGPIAGASLDGRLLENIPITQQSLIGLGDEERQIYERLDTFNEDVRQALNLIDELEGTLRARRGLSYRRRTANVIEEVGLYTQALARDLPGVVVASLNELLSDLGGLLRAGLVPPIGPGEDRYTTQRQQQFQQAIANFNRSDYDRIRAEVYSWNLTFETRVLFAMLDLVDQFKAGQFVSISSVIRAIISDMIQEADFNNRSSWGGIRFTSPSDEDMEDVAEGRRTLIKFAAFIRGFLFPGEICPGVKDTITSFIQQGYRLEIIAESQNDIPLLGSNASGSITNFSLQTPLALDDCLVEDLISNITTGIETATAESVYQLYVDPLGDTPKFPPDTSLTEWPSPGMNFPALWDKVLLHERNTQINFNTTYYGNLNSKNKGGFPRYAGLSIPTYQASSFVNLFTELDAERSIYPHIVRMIENPAIQTDDPEIEMDPVADYRLNWNYYDAERGWVSDDRIFSLAQTDLSRHLHHLQQGGNEEDDLFDVVEDDNPLAEELGIDLGGLLPPIPGDISIVTNCPPFIERLRALLADEVNHNLADDVIEAQFNSPRGLFTGLITGELEYTEPLFYKIERERISNPPGGSVGHLRVQGQGVPILGGQPIFHANKIDRNYFTYEDRFVDYGDTYQYDVDAYTVVMTAEYETIPMTRSQVDCIPSINLNDIERRLGENAIYSLIAFKPKFDIVKIPYLHSEYQATREPGVYDPSRLAVALPPVFIIDNPPIPPGVDIIPYRGVADKMLFLFDLQTDKIVDDYIHLNSSEESIFKAIHSRQKKTICDLCENSVEFASEGEDIQKIQVFRTTNVPEIISEDNPSQLYRDTFGSEPYREIDVTQGSAFVDDIEPNTKYFYMFRSVDKAKFIGQGLVSNPSHIYRVEMVEEDGLIFPIIELYTPQKKKRGVKYRKMAKHIEIKPSLLMAEPNWSADDDNNLSWKIGSREDTIFGTSKGVGGRRFKIRLTSVDTGRKIEINVNFNKEENKVETTQDRDIGE